ncbi:MAG: fatty acyl-AMP ligase [Microbacterium pygmaeum]
MTDSPTGVSALQRTAADFGDERGITYYSSPETTEFRGYTALDRRARTIAQALTAEGIVPGDRAIIALSPGLAWADALYGILYAGAAFVPTPIAGYGTGAALAERIGAITRAAESSVVITDAAVLAALGDEAASLGARVVVLEDLLAAGDPDAWTEPAIDGDSMAWLFYTSGSTGEPKGVIGTHRGLIATAEASIELVGAEPGYVVAGWLPLHHAMGLVMQIIVPVTNGGSAFLSTTEQFQRRPISWLQLISRHRADVSVAGNFAFALCTQFATDEQIADLDLSSLKVLVSGSEPVRPETVTAFVERFAPAGLDPDTIAPALGMTEAMLISAKPLHTPYVITQADTAALERGELELAGDGPSTELVSCGHWTDQTSVRIVDPDTLEPVADGQVGEIWIASPMLSPGYFRRPDATAESFGHSLPGDDRSYLRSGDLGVVLDRELYVTGRLKEVIILRGRNIYPQDIEAAARLVSPAVGVGAAFEIEGHSAPVALVLEVNPEALAESGEDLEALCSRVADVVTAKFSLPGVIVLPVAEGGVPRTATGKVRRRPARAQFDAGTLETLDNVAAPAS